jgi:uncharacterized SAM-binding protein YcdF (DUF218 family)
MFVLSKIFIFLTKPENLLLFFLLAGVALLWSRGERGRRHGRRVLTVVGLVVLAVTILPIPEAILTPLENRFPLPKTLPQRIDGIIILGAGIDDEISAARGQVTLTIDGARVTKAVELARRHPEARILYSGGAADILPGGIPEAPFGRRIIEQLGIAPGRILLEDRSRNTYENVLFSQQLVKPTPGQHWVLITSARHMPRAVGIFRRVGWPVIPYPVAYLTVGDDRAQSVFDLVESFNYLDAAAYEWFGLLAYRLLGRTNALFPAPQ